MTDPPTPRCPRCGEPPTLELAGGEQSFCGNDSCTVFMWDQRRTAAEFEANAVLIDLDAVLAPEDDQPIN